LAPASTLRRRRLWIPRPIPEMAVKRTIQAIGLTLLTGACGHSQSKAHTHGTELASNLDELYKAIEKGTNKKVAFLSKAYFMSVHNVLPANTQPVYCDNSETEGPGVGCDTTEKMVELIRTGAVVAALDAHPTQKMYDDFHIFSSTVISTRGIFMAPLKSADMPHGTSTPAASSRDLSMAVDASIVKMQNTGLDEKLRIKWSPFDIMAVHTCKGDDVGAFKVPNHKDATGLLRSILDNKHLKVGSMGRYNWGAHSGNYLNDPPTGFYPDWITTFCDQFNKLKGPDGVAYNSKGAIKCDRVYQKGSTGVFKDLFDGASHITEPYYIVDGFYTGTEETCSADSDCRPALTTSGKETCNAKKKCEHSKSPRTRHFRISCSTFGIDSKLMTFKGGKTGGLVAGSTSEKEKEVLAPWAIALVAVLGGLTCLIGIFACVMFKREKSGKPLFAPLTAPAVGGSASQYGNSA